MWSEGVLGRDVLSKLALGIDLPKLEATLWNGGNLSRESAVSWIQAVEKFPGDDAVPVAKAIVLSLKEGRGVSILASAQEAKREAYINWGLGNTVLDQSVSRRLTALPFRPSFAFTEEGATTPASVLVGKGVKLGEIEIGWTNHYATQPEKNLGTSYVNFAALQTRRAILDINGGNLWIAQGGENERLSIFLTNIVGVPMRIEASRVFIGPMYLRPFGDPLPLLIDRRVREIGGFSASSIVKALRAGDGGSISYLSSFGDAIKGNFVIVTDYPVNGGYNLNITRSDVTPDKSRI